MTDLLLLEIARLGGPAVRVFKTTQAQEHVKGTDWEWWIGHPGRWLRYAVQAKRLDLGTKRYDTLGHKVGDYRQVNILDRYASEKQATPLYCFYNYIKDPSSMKCSLCRRDVDAPQLGCSVAHLNTVKKALSSRGGRCFDSIHAQGGAIPWRCLLKCPPFIGLFVDSADQSSDNRSAETNKFFGDQPKIYDSLPHELAEAMTVDADTELHAQLVTLSREFYVLNRDSPGAEIEIFPERIAVFNLEETPGRTALQNLSGT